MFFFLVCLFAWRSHLDVAFVRALFGIIWKANESLLTHTLASARARQADRTILFNYSGNRILVHLCLLCALISLSHMPSVLILLMRVQGCLCIYFQFVWMSMCCCSSFSSSSFGFVIFWTIWQHRKSFGFWASKAYTYNKWKYIFIELLASVDHVWHRFGVRFFSPFLSSFLCHHFSLLFWMETEPLNLFTWSIHAIVLTALCILTLAFRGHKHPHSFTEKCCNTSLSWLLLLWWFLLLLSFWV